MRENPPAVASPPTAGLFFGDTMINDFFNCVEITDALGYDPKRYNPVGVAQFRVKLAGFTLTDTDPEWSRRPTTCCPKVRR